ncbi:MAG: hypothetical protein ACR2G3_06380 [Solirubrobacterales bacterium]
MRHWRALAYAVLALAVPLPALALSGGDAAPEAPASLSVSASLDSCGTAADTIVCKIDAGWNEVAGADRYTASVTRADGSVVDFGAVGAGSSSFWVPYAGDGTYTVSVSAYGTPPGSDEREVVARDSAAAGEKGEAAARQIATEPSRPDVVDGDLGEEAPEPAPASPPEEPTCEEREEPTEPDPAIEPGSENEEKAEAAALSAEASQALDETAELPEAVECPAERASAAR